MDNLIAEMQKHNASTRHFIPDLKTSKCLNTFHTK